MLDVPSPREQGEDASWRPPPTCGWRAGTAVSVSSSPRPDSASARWLVVRGRSSELSQPLIAPAFLAARIPAVIHRPHDVKLGPQLPFAAACARLVDGALEISRRPLRRLVRVDPFGQSLEDLGERREAWLEAGIFTICQCLSRETGAVSLPGRSLKRRRRSNSPAPIPASHQASKTSIQTQVTTGCQPHRTSDSWSQPPASVQPHKANAPAAPSTMIHRQRAANAAVRTKAERKRRRN
jgi:hypothetical protein